MRSDSKSLIFFGVRRTRNGHLHEIGVKKFSILESAKNHIREPHIEILMRSVYETFCRLQINGNTEIQNLSSSFVVNNRPPDVGRIT